MGWGVGGVGRVLMGFPFLGPIVTFMLNTVTACLKIAVRAAVMGISAPRIMASAVGLSAGRIGVSAGIDR